MPPTGPSASGTKAILERDWCDIKRFGTNVAHILADGKQNFRRPMGHTRVFDRCQSLDNCCHRRLVVGAQHAGTIRMDRTVTHDWLHLGSWSHRVRVGTQQDRFTVPQSSPARPVPQYVAVLVYP